MLISHKLTIGRLHLAAELTQIYTITREKTEQHLNSMTTTTYNKYNIMIIIII